MSPQQAFHRTLAHGGRIVGAAVLRGHQVYVVDQRAGPVRIRWYIDKKSFVPLRSVAHDPNGGRSVNITLVFEDVPATRANLALASLATLHPHARVVAGTEQARTEYAEATWRGSFRPA